MMKIKTADTLRAALVALGFWMIVCTAWLGLVSGIVGVLLIALAAAMGEG